MRIEVAAATHVGLVRRRNEDALHAGRFLAAVADGMGGHVAGDVASAVAAEVMREYDRPVLPERLGDTMAHAVATVNAALRRRAAADPAVAGMGTTLVAMLWSGADAVVANIGDSRGYLLRPGGGGLRQITEDHTYGHLVAAAAMVPRLPERLSRFLDGRADGRSPDISRWRLRAGDRFLLCSDGLSSYVPHALIEEAATSPERLIELALERGAPDNVTAVVVGAH